jgi:YD repeat-containing protein
VFRFVYRGDDLAAVALPASGDTVVELELTYDPAHRISARFSGGDSYPTEFSYDGAGLVSGVTLPSRYQHYSFDWTDDSMSVTDAFARTNRLCFAKGALVGQIDPSGHESRVVRDDSLRPTEMVDPRGDRTRLAYDADDNVIAVTDAVGRTVHARFDDRHHPIEVTDALGATTSYRYDEFGGVTAVTNALGETTTYERDAGGNLKRIIDFTGRVRMIAEYDARGHAVAITDANGLTTRSAYDANGFAKSWTAPDGLVTLQTTSASGAPLHAVNALGEASDFAYDELGRITRATNPLGSVSIGYDADNRVTATTDQTATSARQMTITYTRDGRVATRTFGDAQLQTSPQGIAGAE